MIAPSTLSVSYRKILIILCSCGGVEAEDKIRKLQLKINKQKKEEKKLRREVNSVFGADDLALDKE